MKLDIGDAEIVIGKRVTIGATIGSTAAVFAHFFPEQAPAIISAAVPVTFLIQLAIVRYFGVTT